MGASTAEVVEEVPVGKKNEPEPSPPPRVPPRLTKEERLALENYALKAENLRLQQERLRQDFQTSTRMLRDLQKEAGSFQLSLNEKYGVDLAQSAIQPDGLIIPSKPGGVSDMVGLPSPLGVGR